MGIQGNENSFFTWDFKVVPDRFSWNLEFGPDDSVSHYFCISVFSPIKAFVKSERLIKFHRQPFIMHSFFKQLGSGLSPQSCLYCKIFRAQSYLMVS